MKSIRINFAPLSIQRAIVRTKTQAWVLGLTGFALCASAGLTALDLRHQQNLHDIELQRLQARLADRTARNVAVKKPVIPEAQAHAVNDAILQLNLPWRDVFDAVEAATPATVALLALEPDARKHVLRGMAEAKTSDDMIAYMERLKKQAFFSRVVLIKHEVNEQDPNRPFRFQFEVEWMEDGQ